MSNSNATVSSWVFSSFLLLKTLHCFVLPRPKYRCCFVVSTRRMSCDESHATCLPRRDVGSFVIVQAFSQDDRRRLSSTTGWLTLIQDAMHSLTHYCSPLSVTNNCSDTSPSSARTDADIGFWIERCKMLQSIRRLSDCSRSFSFAMHRQVWLYYL